jgi:hypothetical protein
VPTSSVSVDIGAVEMMSAPPQPVPVIPLTTQPQDGQYIKWSAAQSAWQPVTFADQETPDGAIRPCGAASAAGPVRLPRMRVLAAGGRSASGSTARSGAGWRGREDSRGSRN